MIENYFRFEMKIEMMTHFFSLSSFQFGFIVESPIALAILQDIAIVELLSH